MNHPPAGTKKPFRFRWSDTSHVTRCALALFFAALVVRLVPFGRYVTPDEPIWVLRSIRLLDAFTSGEWSEVPQTGHPGYTTMVLGALGVQLTKWLQPVTAFEHLTYIRDIAWLAPESSAAFPHFAYFLGTCRLLVALVCASGISLIYLTGKPHFGERTSRLLALFLALDPFFAGHAGLLHTDALQATFVMLSVLIILHCQSGQEDVFTCSFPIAASALFLALAGLTKTLGLLVAPGIALAILLWGKGSFWQRFARVTALALMSILFIFILFPPFWTEPVATLQRLLEAVTYHQGAGLRNVFFLGQFHVDPGPFFYPAVILFRLTTPVFAGLLSGIWRRKAVRYYAVKWFLVPLAVYILALTLASKKFDRYILTAIPLLTAIACIQLHAFYNRHKTLLLALLCLPWALVAIIPLYHANTLLGGPWIAQYIIPFGWGEGSGFAAQKLNHIFSNPSEHSITTGDVPGVASLFAGQVQSKEASRAMCADGLISRTAPGFTGYKAVEDIVISGLHLTTIFTHTFTYPDGAVLVPGQIAGIPSTNVPPQTTTPLLQQWLAERFSGLPFMWIHTVECDPITEAQLTALLCPAAKDDGACSCIPAGVIDDVPIDRCQFSQLTAKIPDYMVRVGDILDIAAATWSPTIQAPETLDVQVRWVVKNPYERIVANLNLRDADGLIWAEGSSILESSHDWRKSARSPGNVLDGQIHLPLHPSLLPGDYILSLSFIDNENRMIGLINPDGTFGGIRVDIGYVAVISSPFNQPEIALPIPLDISFPGLHIRAASPPPASLYAGDALPFRLEIARSTQPLSETTLWTVQCDDVTHLRGSLLDVPGNPDEWQAGHYYELRYAPRTDSGISDAECSLILISDTRAPVTIGTFHIQARERSFSLPNTPQYILDYKIGSFSELIGVDIPQADIDGSSPFIVTLYWQALEAAEINYTVFVHLAGDDGKVWGQSDAPPEGGNAPTATWLPGQVIVDLHHLDIKTEIPPGEYTLYAGLYDAESGYRETTFSGSGERIASDQIPLGVIVVGD